MCIAAVGAGLLWKWTQEELQVLGCTGGAQPKAEDNHPGVTVVLPPVRPWQVFGLYLSVGWQFLQEAIKVTRFWGYSHFPGSWQHRVWGSTPPPPSLFPSPWQRGVGAGVLGSLEQNKRRGSLSGYLTAGGPAWLESRPPSNAPSRSSCGRGAILPGIEVHT